MLTLDQIYKKNEETLEELSFYEDRNGRLPKGGTQYVGQYYVVKKTRNKFYYRLYHLLCNGKMIESDITGYIERAA